MKDPVKNPKCITEPKADSAKKIVNVSKNQKELICNNEVACSNSLRKVILNKYLNRSHLKYFILLYLSSRREAFLNRKPLFLSQNMI